MRQGQTTGAIRLWLLALVLALALTGYTMNPAPSPVRQVKQDEGQPDEQRRAAKSPAQVSDELELIGAGVLAPATNSLSSSAELSIDDLEWPEVL